MILWFFRHVLYLRQALLGDQTPHYLALGCSVGLVLGLIPKGNLLALLVATVLFSLRLNLAAAMLSTLAFSFIGPLLDPLTDRIGKTLLQADQLRPFWTWLYELPLAPWTYFNNTVVLGSFLLASLTSIPWYFAARWAICQWQDLRADPVPETPQVAN